MLAVAKLRWGASIGATIQVPSATQQRVSDYPGCFTTHGTYSSNTSVGVRHRNFFWSHALSKSFVYRLGRRVIGLLLYSYRYSDWFQTGTQNNCTPGWQLHSDNLPRMMPLMGSGLAPAKKTV